MRAVGWPRWLGLGAAVGAEFACSRPSARGRRQRLPVGLRAAFGRGNPPARGWRLSVLAWSGRCRLRRRGCRLAVGCVALTSAVGDRTDASCGWECWPVRRCSGPLRCRPAAACAGPTVSFAIARLLPGGCLCWPDRVVRDCVVASRRREFVLFRLAARVAVLARLVRFGLARTSVSGRDSLAPSAAVSSGRLACRVRFGIARLLVGGSWAAWLGGCVSRSRSCRRPAVG